MNLFVKKYIIASILIKREYNCVTTCKNMPTWVCDVCFNQCEVYNGDSEKNAKLWDLLENFKQKEIFCLSSNVISPWEINWRSPQCKWGFIWYQNVWAVKYGFVYTNLSYRVFSSLVHWKYFDKKIKYWQTKSTNIFLISGRKIHQRTL